MVATRELLRRGQHHEIWQRYCGFIDLSLKEFMSVQERLLLEQIQLLGHCALGRTVMGPLPSSVQDFRATVPVTTYRRYFSYLMEKNEEVLPARPHAWARTSGRSGEYSFKWVPMTEEYLHGGAGDFLAATIFSCCKERGHVALEEGDTYLYCVAPRPLASGYMPEAMLQEFPFRFLPPPEQAERLSFQERVQVGFQLALGEGLDVFFGLASILARVGEQFGSAGERQGIPAKLLLSPKASWRMIRGIVRSKRAKRRMLPKDIWRLKGLVAGGVDTDLYRSKVKEYWGVEPVEVYASTETGIISMQTWERKGLVFTPSGNFLEFMPWDEYDRFGEADGYQPKTLLLDEVEVGESYVIVCTNFRGGPFVRYVLGDMITITSRESRPLGIDIPHMVFHSRVDDIIDIAGFTRLTEKSIWRALEDSGIAYVDWTARKESTDDQQPLLHLYLEVPESERRGPTQIASAVHLSLQNVDNDYADLERVLGIRPLQVTLLSPGTSDRFLDERQTAGADLGFLKPRHVNTRDEDIELLMSLSRSMGEANS